MRFSDIPGHEDLKRNLRELVASGHVPHAMMLSGPAGTGKMMLARAFAQYLHCESPRDGEPCGSCRSCRLHRELSHPDLHFVYPIVKSEKMKRYVSADVADLWRTMLSDHPAMPPEKWLSILEAGNSQPSIYVREADELVLADAYPPYASARKIYIVWQPERMQLQAANKLLKVIEEPSEGTMFIFVSDNELEVLPTIFSRLQRFHTGRLSDDEIRGYLNEKFHFTDEQGRRYARLCNGSLILADEFGSHTGENEEFLTIYRDVMRSAYAKKVAALRQTSEQVAAFGREKIKRFLVYMSRMIRENFIYNMKMPQLTSMTPDEEAFSIRFSPFVNHGNVEDFAAATDRAREDIEANGNSKLVLFDYFLICIILLHRRPTA